MSATLHIAYVTTEGYAGKQTGEVRWAVSEYGIYGTDWRDAKAADGGAKTIAELAEAASVLGVGIQFTTVSEKDIAPEPEAVTLPELEDA
jgi:hypothetical protein